MCKLIASEELWLLLDALQELVPEEVHQHLENINTSTTPLMVCLKQSCLTALSNLLASCTCICTCTCVARCSCNVLNNNITILPRECSYMYVIMCLLPSFTPSFLSLPSSFPFLPPLPQSPGAATSSAVRTPAVLATAPVTTSAEEEEQSTCTS